MTISQLPKLTYQKSVGTRASVSFQFLLCRFHVKLILQLFVYQSLLRHVLLILCTGELVCRKPSDPIDGAPFIAGVITLLKQFHSDNVDKYLALCCQFIKSSVIQTYGSKVTELSQDSLNLMVFLDDFVYFGGLSKKVGWIFVLIYLVVSILKYQQLFCILLLCFFTWILT